MMIVSLIVLAINSAIGAFVFYRCGRQSAYNDLVKAYKLECQENDRLWVAIEELEKRLENSCDGKEAGND